MNTEIKEESAKDIMKIGEETFDENLLEKSHSSEESSDHSTEIIAVDLPKKEETKKTANSLLSYLPYLSLVIGVIIIAMGASLMQKTTSMSHHKTNDIFIQSYSFGADYYTESYEAAYDTVQKLNSIDQGISGVCSNMDTLMNGIYYSIGILTIAIGLGTSGISLCFIRKK